MLETQLVISFKREQIRTQIRKQKNEEIFNKKRNTLFKEQAEILNYLNLKNEDYQIHNLDDIIKNKSQNLFECQLIVKWLLEYEDLELSHFGLELYFYFQTQISLNLELKYIKIAAKIFRNNYFLSEDSLLLLTKLTQKSTLRSQFLIQELQVQEFINELMDSHLNTLPLICNLLVDEKFIFNFFNQNKIALDYFRAKLFDLRSSSYVINLLYSISYSHILCKIIVNVELIMDLINMKPNQEILEILINIKLNTDLFDKVVKETDLEDYLIEIFDNYEFHEQILQLFQFLLETKNQNLMNKLFQRRHQLQNLTYHINNYISQLAINLLEKYL